MADDTVHDPHDLTGRTALITGASRGIGRAIAEELASHGCAVALAARTADTVQQAAEAIEQSGGRAVAIAADVTEDGAAERLVTETVSALGGLDISDQQRRRQQFLGARGLHAACRDGARRWR